MHKFHGKYTEFINEIGMWNQAQPKTEVVRYDYSNDDGVGGYVEIGLAGENDPDFFAWEAFDYFGSEGFSDDNVFDSQEDALKAAKKFVAEYLDAKNLVWKELPALDESFDMWKKYSRVFAENDVIDYLKRNESKGKELMGKYGLDFPGDVKNLSGDKLAKLVDDCGVQLEEIK